MDYNNINKMSEDITQLKVTTGEINRDLKNLTKLIEGHIEDEGENRRIQESLHKELMENKANKTEVAPKWAADLWKWTGSALGLALLGFLIWVFESMLKNHII